MMRTLLAATVAALSLSLAAAAHAQAPTPPPAPPVPPVPPPPAAPPAADAAGTAMPPPEAAAPQKVDPHDALPTPGAAGDSTLRRDTFKYPRPDDLAYGLGLRFRWVSVPSWMLNIFTKKNVPLEFEALPGSFAIEGFRRKGNFDVLLAAGYQKMAPKDGNWLGTGKAPGLDTDFIQFRDFALLHADISFIWHQMFTDWIGMHYGAGIGIAAVLGDMLRTSSYNCTYDNLNDLTQCHPRNVNCTSTSCNEAQLVNSQGAMKDIPDDPHRFSDDSVPGIIPIINAVVGVDFRVPSLRGWEAKIEGGFYDAFFLGGGVAYTF